MRDLVFETDSMRVEVEWFENKPFIHCTVYKWSISVYRKHLPLWNYFISILKENNIKEYYSVIDKDNKILKFNQMMGLKIAKEFDNHYLMIGE